MSRDALIADFLARHGFAAARALPLAQDASFRRYLRLAGGPRPAVLMDAPPPEDVRPFLRIAAHLAGLGLSAPEIIAADPAAGLVLEEDLGDSLFAARLDRAPPSDPPAADVLALFDAAIDTLANLQRAAPPPDLPAWDSRAMTAATLDPLFDWWWPVTFGAPAPDAARADIAAALRATLAPLEHAPKGFVHRDFFAGNLLWLPERVGQRRVGILDFQSAALGHPAYDLVSLVQDARRDLPASLTEHAVARLLAARPELDPAAFRTVFAACAAQRHLRVATQWVRLARRDQRPQYLAHGPHTWRLLAAALRHPIAAPLAAALDRWVPMGMRGTPEVGKQGQGALPPGPPPGDKSPGPLGVGSVGVGGVAAGGGATEWPGRWAGTPTAQATPPPHPQPRHPPPPRNQRKGSKGPALGGGPGGSAPWPCLPIPGSPHTAMVLAAGLGTRMRPLTDATAKPLLPLGGRSLLNHALDRLAAVGVEFAVVNAFWQADRVVAALARRRDPLVEVVQEAALLDTGGGVRAVLDRLGDDPFFVVNGDAVWLDGPRPALARLVAAFDPAAVDGVLLVHRTCQVHADVGLGDFVLDPWGGLRRRREREVAPYIYAGVQLIAPALLARMPEGRFSMNLAWDRALAAGRLRAIVHDGLWFHLSTPPDLAEAEAVLHENRTGETR